MIARFIKMNECEVDDVRMNELNERGVDTVMMNQVFAHNYIFVFLDLVIWGNGVEIYIIPFSLNKEENPNFQGIGNKIITPLQ